MNDISLSLKYQSRDSKNLENVSNGEKSTFLSEYLRETKEIGKKFHAKLIRRYETMNQPYPSKKQNIFYRLYKKIFG